MTEILSVKPHSAVPVLSCLVYIVLFRGIPSGVVLDFELPHGLVVNIKHRVLWKQTCLKFLSFTEARKVRELGLRRKNWCTTETT